MVKRFPREAAERGPAALSPVVDGEEFEPGKGIENRRGIFEVVFSGRKRVKLKI